MGNLNNEKDFIDGLIKEGVVQDLTYDGVLEENKKVKDMQKSIEIPKNLMVNESVDEHIIEAPEDEIDLDPMDTPMEPVPSIDEPTDVDVDVDVEPNLDAEPAPEEVGDPIVDAVKALFLTSIVRAGANFKEYKSEAMKEALAKQGVDESTYNAIGKALYELDTTSEMFN